jgi:hypothetical protein
VDRLCCGAALPLYDTLFAMQVAAARQILEIQPMSAYLRRSMMRCALRVMRSRLQMPALEI